jgi:hypothetical protein
MTNPNAAKQLVPDVYLVNAATALGDVRLCFSADDSPAQPSDVTIPQTNYPGLVTGGAVFFRRNAEVRGKMVTAFAVSAAGLGAAEYGRTPYSCKELSTNPIIKRTAIAPFSPAPDGAALYALVGCPAGVGDLTRCGPTFDNTKGNLRFVEVPIRGLAPPAGMGAFSVNLSPSIEKQVNGTSASAHVGPLADPCSGTIVGQGAFSVGLTQPSETSILAPVGYDSDGFALCLSQQSVVTRSYASAQQATDPTSVPNDFFHVGADYVFAVVGDTTVQSGPESVHALAIPFEATK